ncbi:MAG: hypothetical protein ABSH32_05595, partial [Bryobacteraceae bacterium]
LRARRLVTKFPEVGGQRLIKAQKTAGHSRADTASEYTILQRGHREKIVREVQTWCGKAQQAPGPKVPAAAAAGGKSSKFFARIHGAKT